MLLLLHAHLLLSRQLFQLRLKLCHLRVYIRLLGNQAAKVNAVQLRKLRDSAFRVAGELFRVGHKLADTANSVHALEFPMLLIGTQDFVQRVKPLAVVRVFLLFLGYVALLLFPEPVPRLGNAPIFRMAGNLAERFLVRLAPNARGFKGREFCRDWGRIERTSGRGGRVRAGGFNRRLQVIAQ